MIQRILLFFFALQVAFHVARADDDSISLYSFGAPPPGISQTCNREYKQIIPSCTTADFEVGASCSAACETALLNTQNHVKVACGQTEVESTTLLGSIFQDQIIGALCPNVPSTMTASALTETSRTPITADTSSSGHAPFVTTVTSMTSTLPTTTTTILAAPSEITTVTTSSSPTASIATSSQSSTSSSPTTTPTAKATSRKAMTMLEDQIAAEADTGGGSPFDILSTSDLSRPASHLTSVLVVALVSVGLLLGR
ncbi:MAG: hypothetical protein M1818_005677 [Claussenomyces sp. TS43310]|nr:MAG: hypothetical protein M1818_005677 [Claussenomyces sp. TS43310]